MLQESDGPKQRLRNHPAATREAHGCCSLEGVYFEESLDRALVGDEAADGDEGEKEFTLHAGLMKGEFLYGHCPEARALELKQAAGWSLPDTPLVESGGEVKELHHLVPPCYVVGNGCELFVVQHVG